MTGYDKSADQLVLAGRMGAELRAALDLVTETESAGAPKFAPEVCRKLRRMILCRNYAKALLELSHLAVVAALSAPRPGAYLAFFYESGPARAAGFRGFLTHAALGTAPGIRLESDRVVLSYPDGGFEITYARMPLLSALLEFLLTALGYGALDEAFAELTGPEATDARVKTAAKEIAKQLYGYLNAQLGSLHDQRQQHALIGFLTKRQGGTFSAAQIEGVPSRCAGCASPEAYSPLITTCALRAGVIML